MRWVARVALTLALASQAGCGAVHHAARSAAEGAMSTVAGKIGDRDSMVRMAEELKRGAARGLVDELGQPEQLARLEKIAATVGAGVISGASNAAPRARGKEGATAVEAIAQQAAGALSQRMITELGKAGQGPLALSLSATSEQMSESMARGARGDLASLFPECRGSEGSTCLERVAERVGRASGAGVAAGIRSGLGAWLLVSMFGAGAVFAVVLGWAWGLYRARRPAQTSSRAPPRRRTAHRAGQRAPIDGVQWRSPREHG